MIEEMAEQVAQYSRVEKFQKLTRGDTKGEGLLHC